MRQNLSQFVLGSIAFSMQIGLTATAAADDYLWQPYCDTVWQTCCDQDVSHKRNNWGRVSVAPVCPPLPIGADNVTIIGDCTVGPSPAPGTAAGVLIQSGGTFTLNGNLAIGTSAEFAGPVVWNAAELGRFGGAGPQYARTNGPLTMTGDADKTLSFLGGFRLINANIGTWSGNGNWTIGMIPGGCCPAIFENAAGATFTVQNNASIFQTAFGTGRIENEGTLIKDASAGTSEWAVELVNSGTIHIKTGELKLTRAGHATGLFQVDAGATLSFAGNFYELLPGANITGAGTALVEHSGTNPGILINNDITLGRLDVAPDGITGGTGLLEISDRLNVNAGNMSVHTLIQRGGWLEITGASRGFWPLDVAGVAHIPAGAALQPQNSPLNVLAGGEIQIEDGGALAPTGNGVQPIENHGTIRKLAGGGTGTIASAFGWYLNNDADGRIVCEEGVLDSANNLQNSGEINIAAGAVVRQRGWANYHAGTTITGDGWFHLDNTYNNFIDAGFTLVVPRLRKSGTSVGLLGPGNLTITQYLDFQGGWIDTPLLTIQPGAILASSGPDACLADGTVENLGTTRVIGQNLSYFGNFNNRPGATIDLQSDFYFGGRFGNNPLNNEGTFVKSAGTGDSPIGGTFANAGTVRLQSGRIVPNAYVQSAGVTQLNGGGMLTSSLTLDGGTLSGSGTLNVNLSNVAGVVAPGDSAGRLTIANNANPNIAGDYSQGVNGSLRMQVGGVTPGVQHDQLIVARNASLNGGLNIDLINGFAPQLGDQFVILTAGGTRSGTFARVSGAQIGGGLRFNVQYNANNVTLVVAAGGTTPGDLNGDGHVGLSDLTAFLSSFGVCDGQTGFNPAADLDGDGCVSLSDLVVLLSNFGA